MTVVQIAVCIVAALCGGGAVWLAERTSAPGWVVFFIGVLVALLVYTGGPALWG